MPPQDYYYYFRIIIFLTTFALSGAVYELSAYTYERKRGRDIHTSPGESLREMKLSHLSINPELAFLYSFPGQQFLVLFYQEWHSFGQPESLVS